MDLREIFESARTIAVVGMSPNSDRDSHVVGRYLHEAGYRVIPVNPVADEIIGLRCVASLRDLGEPVDVVDIFRRPEHVPAIVEDAIAVGAKVVWMQDGVVHEEAAARAREAGLAVVMDRCMLRDHRRLMG